MARILFLDDDPLVGMMARMALGRLGHAIDTFTASAPALTAFRESPGAYSLVVSDLHLGPECGFDFCKQVIELQPEACVLLVSGLIEAADVDRARDLGAVDLLSKADLLSRLPAMLAQACC